MRRTPSCDTSTSPSCSGRDARERSWSARLDRPRPWHVRPQSAVKQLDARLVVAAALPAERIAQERTAGRRTIVAVAGIGALALLIALGGVAAIASHSVALRTREIGIRIALGARRADAVGLIVRLALAPVAIGAIAGLAIASLGSRVLVRQLYGISPLDPVSFTGTAVFLMLAAAAAAWLPARRAAVSIRSWPFGANDAHIDVVASCGDLFQARPARRRAARGNRRTSRTTPAATDRRWDEPGGR